jgi:hypothetical protein
MTIYRRWQTLLMVLVIFYTVNTPVTVAFETGQENNLVALCVQILFTLVFVVDIWVNLHLAFRHRAGVGSAVALVAFICALCSTLRTQIS